MCVAAASPQAAGRGAAREELVRARMLATYIHGVTDDLARQVLEPSDVGVLRALLRDPGFERRDNIVAFLAHLDRGEATSDLIAFLSSPPGDVEIPEEDRSLLLAPQALGHIAARGDRAALDALLQMTEAGSRGGPLALAASRGHDPEALRADLLEMAFRGLAFSRSPRARERLVDLSTGRIRLEAAARDLTKPARASLKLFDDLGSPGGGATVAPPSLSSAAVPWAPAALDASAATQGTTTLTGTTTQLLDQNGSGRVGNYGLTYANHVAVSSPMTDARLDQILKDANLRVGRTDFVDPNSIALTDVACCTTVSRSGSNLTFGTAGDGLDSIDDSGELSTVLNNPIARVHVVRAITWCGGLGTNIIGCAWINGNGMSLVRLSQVSGEGILWVHEYGHNTGLNHVGDSRYIMYAVDTGGNNGLGQTECNSYHQPSSGSGAFTTDIGACTDLDVDAVHDVVDNCPFIYNYSQLDSDLDGQGDPCDGDNDNDGVLDPNDCATLNNQIWYLPGEATDLQLTHSSGGTSLTWSPPTIPGGTSTSLRYDVIQSSVASNFDTNAACLESNDGPNTLAVTGTQGPPLWVSEGNKTTAQYGAAVASAGDVDGDGFDDLIVGAPQFNNGQDFEGIATVYRGSATGIAQTGWVIELDTDFSRLGQAVAPAGDVNHDGYADVVVGAPNFDNGILFGGAVFVYQGSPAGLPSSPSWTASSDIAGASFGNAVASGDFNHDTYTDVVVGAPLYDNGLPGEGRVFVYPGSPSGLSASPTWSASGGQSDARFGWSVAAGDVNGDGFDDLIVGAPKYSNGETNEGRVYVFMGSAAGLSPTPALTLESDQAGALFGTSVSSGGDVDKDGFEDVVVGAPSFDNGQSNEGTAFFYRGSASGLNPAVVWKAEADQADASMGGSVAIVGDTSGDGFADIVVGASGYDNDQVNEGRAYLYFGTSAGPTTSPVTTFEGDQAGAALGVAVGGGDFNGDGLDDIVLGASLFDNGQTDEGRALVYTGSRDKLPLPNKAFFYYIRSENGCGSGPVGFTSGGVQRTARSCP